MVDRDLARLYQVETKVLKQAVRRNISRFPSDFHFQLTEIEGENLRSQFVTSSSDWGGSRYLSYAFTELGIAMLSSVLKSERAIQTNIAIMRAFFELRRSVAQESDLAKKVLKFELETSQLFTLVFHRLDELEMKAPLLPPNRKKIGI